MPIKFCSEAYFFQAWGSLMSLKSQIRDSQLRVPPRGLMLRIFTSWKNPLTSAGFEPANLGSRGKHVTPRLPRPSTILLHVLIYPTTYCFHITWNDMSLVVAQTQILGQCRCQFFLTVEMHKTHPDTDPRKLPCHKPSLEVSAEILNEILNTFQIR